MRRKLQSGFSLIELLVVVAIIMTISAIVIPNYMAAKIRANESVAVANVRAVLSAQVIYNNMFPQVGYAPNISSLAGNATPPTPGAAGLVPNELAKPGRSYTLTLIPKAEGDLNIGFTVTNQPAHPGVTGRRGFCANETGAISFSEDGSGNCAVAIPF